MRQVAWEYYKAAKEYFEKNPGKLAELEVPGLWAIHDSIDIADLMTKNITDCAGFSHRSVQLFIKVRWALTPFHSESLYAAALNKLFRDSLGRFCFVLFCFVLFCFVLQGTQLFCVCCLANADGPLLYNESVSIRCCLMGGG